MAARLSQVLALLQPMEVKYTLEHKSSVDCCRFVGDYGDKKAGGLSVDSGWTPGGLPVGDKMRRLKPNFMT